MSGYRLPAEVRRRRSLETKREITPSGCWVWTGSIGNHGRGQYRTQTRNLLVHVMAYELYVGPVPEGKKLHHECEEPRCFNPEHLTPVTPAEHLRIHRSHEACPKCGSTRPRIVNMRHGKPNGSKCRDCHNRKTLERYHQKRAAQ